MRSRSVLVVVVIVGLLSAADPAAATAVLGRSTSTAEEFARGSLEGTAIDETGAVRLSPDARTLWGPAAGIVWDLAPSDGQGIFVALSGPGRLLHIPREAVEELWFETDPESLITSLAAANGGVWFGESPGAIVRFARSAGTAKVEADLEAVFVWAVEPADGGGVWVGTGVPGMLVEVAPGSESPSVLFSDEDDPVRCIERHPDGGSVFGTGARGRVLRLLPDRTIRSLLDVEESEIVDLAVDGQGTIYALAARSVKQPSSGARGAPAPSSVGVMRVEVSAQAPESNQDSSREEPPEPKRPEPQRFTAPPGGALYRIDPEGTAVQIWESSLDLPFAVVADGSRVVVATGDAGRIYTLDRDGHVLGVMRIASNQASALERTTDGAWIAGGTTDARIERIGPGPRRQGSYRTEVLDAGAQADWGRVRYRAEVPRGATLRVLARSGNSAEPDDSWSDWVELRAREPETGAIPGVPLGRWFQVRFDMGAGRGGSPTLHWVDVRYAGRNRPPRVESLQVERAGIAWVRAPLQNSGRLGPVVIDDPVARSVVKNQLRTGARVSPIRKSYEAGVRTLVWSAIDPDGDRLSYSVELRRDGTDEWHPLVAERPESFFSWDTRDLPDGRYRIRLTVDDGQDNSPGSRLAATRMSDLFVIDHTHPVVERIGEVDRDRRTIDFVARDPGGLIAVAEFSLDGGLWTLARAIDGVSDSERERFRVELDRLPHVDRPLSLRVRVTDTHGNVGGDARLLRDDGKPVSDR